ncbi:ankyrin repeat-containing protein At5g02620-like isoform X2 [Tripterygium wilfordii]|uniref:ankyrin repeat-containing protein At5g02620-like isoform X2 n=1 Tax=Tripterygium wilfordii TaxID=458696 RepID=UPI0018F829E4|nr:ankyrin repeat-containing protein At5g02620-like isoform X2 [Tripterygium wilfordii]
MRDLKAESSEPQERSNMDPVRGTEDTEYIRNLPILRAIDKGDLETAKNLLDKNPGALIANLTSDEDKALHVAVLAGNVDIVEELVNRLSRIDLQVKNKKDSTALNYAAMGGIKAIAEHLIRKNRNLITIPNGNGQIPVVVASLYSHKDMVWYLYENTPKEELSPEKGPNGAMLLTTCVMGDLFDIALDLLQHHRRLAVTHDTDGDTAPAVLAQKPSAFPSGTPLRFWQHWIYSLICLPSPQSLHNTNGDIESQSLHTGSTIRRNMIAEGLHKLREMIWLHLKGFVPAIKYLYDLKLTHAQAQKLLCCICEVIFTSPESEFEKTGVYKAVFNAVKHGIVEFIEEIIKQYPDIIWSTDKNGRGIFLCATACRQEKIFNLIFHLGAKKSPLAASWDYDSNTILHQAALIAPSSQLDRVSGAALQMQRELLWLKEVERIVHPKYKEMTNKDGKTARALFTDEHKELKKEGEEWMKKTAESSTVVAALIATIMFAAAFTLPGGLDDKTGDPRYLDRNSFMVFIISDAMSLLASSVSLLMFLRVLTSLYREEDFLISLPTKLIVGLSTLFFSIAAMMITFGINLIIMLSQRVLWVSFPIILLGSLPVTIFAMLQFPLFIEILRSTYGPGIFDKPKKWRFMSWKMKRN